jgi:hypothetical protein
MDVDDNNDEAALNYAQDTTGVDVLKEHRRKSKASALPTLDGLRQGAMRDSDSRQNVLHSVVCLPCL